MKLKLTSLIFITIIAFVFSCGKSDQTYTIETKDGVKYVHNLAPAWGDTLKVALEFVQKIGELDTEDENYQLYRPGYVLRDADENIYILENGNKRIQKFDKHGKYLATIGRRGQGPSEFMMPMCLEMDAEGNLYVSDFSQKCILVLTNEGKEIRRIRPFDVTATIRVTKSGNIFAQTGVTKMLLAEDIARDTRLICLHDNDGNLIKEFGELKDYGDKKYTRDGNYFKMSLDSYDNLYIAFNNQNRIEKYSSAGELIFRADRPLNYKLTHEMETITFPPDIHEEPLILPKFTRVTVAMGVDHKNRIWVQTYKEQEGDKPSDYLEFEIFDENGVLLGKYPVQQTGRIEIREDRLYFMDDYYEMCIYEYKIVEK